MHAAGSGIMAMPHDSSKTALVYRNPLETETDIFVGRREDVFRELNGQWKIDRRQIILELNVLPTKNLTVFLSSMIWQVNDGSRVDIFLDR